MPPSSDPTSGSVPIREGDLPESARDFVKVEKNLSSLGFFTPSKSRGKVEHRERVLRFRREVEGRRIETTARILPSAKYGLPTTADQDKFFAFLKIVGEKRSREGKVENPVGFTTAELLHLLGLQDAGRNYQEVHDWLQRMTLTGIQSEGVIWFAERQAWVSDTFHVFDRVLAYGSDMGDGRKADQNYVWLSEWQLENIANNYLIPIDLEAYRHLRTGIAKALVPLLQMWLYATRSVKQFEKRYEDLCTLLDIRPQVHLAHVRKQLEPAMAELQAGGYLASWAIEPTFDGRGWKLVAEHGVKFFGDQQLRQAVRPIEGRQPDGKQKEAAIDIGAESSLLEELTRRGIGERQARALLRELAPGQDLRRQLVWIDSLLAQTQGRIRNPPGFCLTMLRDNVIVPRDFEIPGETTAEPVELEDWATRTCQEEEYREWREQQVKQHIDMTLGHGKFDQRVAHTERKERARHPYLPQATLHEIAISRVTRELERELRLPSFEDWLRD